MALFPQREYHRYILSSLVLVVCSYTTMLVDAAVGGHFLGGEAVSAVNLAMPISEIFYTFTLLLGIGSSIKASIDIGRNDIAQVRRTFTTAITSTFAGLLLLALAFSCSTRTDQQEFIKAELPKQVWENRVTEGITYCFEEYKEEAINFYESEVDKYINKFQMW